MRRTLMGLVVVASLAGCGDDDAVVMDAGVDASSDDASIVDAWVQPDAPEPDAGTDASVEPPMPITMARTEALASLGDLRDAVENVPAAMRDDIDLARVSVLGVRVDAVIGEKSVIAIAGVIGEKLETRSLGAAAIPALVVVRQLERALRDLSALILNGFPEPEMEPVVTALTALRDDLAVLLAHMRERYTALVDATAAVRLRTDPDYVAARSLTLVSGRAQVSVIVEGEDPTAPEAVLSIRCDTGAPAYRVFDEESGAMIADGVASGTSVSAAFPVPAERASSVRIEVNDTLGATTPSPTCDVSVTGTRDWRGDPITVDGGERSALEDLVDTFEQELRNVEDTIARLDGEVSPAAQSGLELAREHLEELVTETAVWRTSTTLFEEEDRELMELMLGSVLEPVSIVVETQLGMRAEELSSIVTDLEEMRAASDAARVLLDPAHETTS